jgi:hypothetical protein
MLKTFPCPPNITRAKVFSKTACEDTSGGSVQIFMSHLSESNRRPTDYESEQSPNT